MQIVYLAWLILAYSANAAAPGLHTQTAELKRTAASPLPVRAIWPDGDGPFPVIVFSHGIYGNRDGYKPLVEYWARAGYLVLLPSHQDRGEPKFADVLERPIEVSLVLDRVPVLVEKAGLKDKVDLENVGVGGHSLGAHTATMVGGLVMTNEATGKPVSTADSRVDSILVISPAGTSPAMRPSAWDEMVSPTLLVVGSKDEAKRMGKGPEWRMQAWSHLREGWLLWIDKADHSYGGIGSGDIKKRAHVEIVQEATLKFWDATLKQDAAARAWLDSDTLKEKSSGKARIDQRKVQVRSQTHEEE